VTLTARREQWLSPAKEELQGLGIECLPIIADVSSVDSVKDTVAKTMGRWDIFSPM
jgi:NADP-dependent 3-hydroxy acid dehydrogenase YdfG